MRAGAETGQVPTMTTYMEDITGADDDVLDALDALVDVLEENNRRNMRAIERAQTIRDLRTQGLSYTEIVTAEARPLIVEMATANLEALLRTGSRLRREQAAALHREGMTMDRIAELFGVTRQRVSALIRSHSQLA
jgi:predicted XRE-type DNA-binding protein